MKILPISWRKSLAHLLERSAVLLFWPAVIVIVWGELTPNVGIHNVWDKLQHFVAYAGLAGMAAFVLRDIKRGFWAALALIAMGAILEVLQSYTGRDASIWDEFANILGASAGCAAAFVLRKFLNGNVAEEL